VYKDRFSVSRSFATIETDVLILGAGGGGAFDCAFPARRLGADEVHVACLEGADCMVAPADDLIQAK
jgi:formate dehydrogenase beta subunit